MADPPPHLHQEPEPSAHQVRGKFATRIGFMLAAVGSAIGLGNIWKFPYIMGENGGAAFIIVYLFCIALVGLPVLIAEFAIGRRGQTSAVSSFRIIAPGTPWWLNGLLGVAAGFVILSFYSAVAGWVLKYFVTGVLDGFSQFTSETSAELFGQLILGFEQPLIYQLIVMALTAGIIFFGIESGVERFSKILMPLLFIILILLVIRSVTLEGAGEGLRFMFNPDFTKLNGEAVLEALGHACFTLSVGMGAMITYASYLDRKAHLGKVGLSVAALDTLIALMAGIIIFPAVFAFGMEPGGGPALMFITLPQIFAQMPMGQIVGAAFFFLVFIAALTSTISILEPVVTWMVDDLNFHRHTATAIAAFLIFLVGIPACLSVGEGGFFDQVLFIIGGTPYRLFDFLDMISSKFMLPVGALVVCLFIAFAWKREGSCDEVSGEGKNPRHWMVQAWYWLAVTIAPLAILAVLVFGILDLFDLNLFAK